VLVDTAPLPSSKFKYRNNLLPKDKQYRLQKHSYSQLDLYNFWKLK